MGADLVINAIAIRDGVTLNWEAGKQEAKNYQFSEEQKKDFTDMWLGDHYEPGELYMGEEPFEDALRKYMVNQVHELETSMESYARDLAWLTFGEHTIFICGGSSWGDSPGPTWDALQDLWEVPAVLWAIGFEWPPISPVEQEDLPLQDST